MLTSVPMPYAKRVLAKSVVIRMEPATSAVRMNAMVNGSSSAEAEETPAIAARSRTRAFSMARSGATKIAKNGSMRPMLTISANALQIISRPNSSNCRRRRRVRCTHSRFRSARMPVGRTYVSRAGKAMYRSQRAP
jgi:hypothetical protein